MFLYVFWLIYISHVTSSNGNRSIVFRGPVHVIENQIGQFICSLNTREEFQNISVKNLKTEIISWLESNGDEKCVVFQREYRKYISNCSIDNGVLSYEMAFLAAFEGPFTCQIGIKNELYNRSINVLVNATSPVFNSTDRLIYYENETFSFSCQSVNNNNTNILMIINYIVYANGIQEDLDYSSLITTTQLNLNQTLHDASIGCGIQYQFSRYNQNFTKLNISYKMKRIEIYPNRDVYNPTDIIRCYTEGNPTPTVEWELITTDFDDWINRSSLTIGNRLGNRTCNCRAQQNYRNQTILLSTQFVIVVKAYQSTVPITTTTERWKNIKIEFSGDKLSNSNISEHRWEIVPKWAGFINGTVTANSTHIIRFNNTDIIEHSDFIYDTNVTFSSLSYRIADSATYGEYTCRMYNRYNETISATTYFIQGQNPNITMVNEGENFIINCSTTTLGSPIGIMMIFKRDKNGAVETFSPFNKSNLHVIVVANFNWKVDGDFIFCIIKNEFYEWKSQEIPINILYPARDMKITPKREEYRNGDTVKCEAVGNPLPKITWWSSVNDSYFISSFPNTITLTPPSNAFVTYTCVALNVINGVTNSIANAIFINGTYYEFVNFSVNPPVVGIEKMVMAECRVDNMNVISLMNIKDNDQLMVSINQGILTVEKSYRNKISNTSLTQNSISFMSEFSKDQPRNLSCYVIFASKNRLERRVELKNAIEIEYKTKYIVIGKPFSVSCVQNYRNMSELKVGINVGSENIVLKTFKNVSQSSVELINFDIEKRFINGNIFCSLIFNGELLKTVIGERLVETFGIWEVIISPNLPRYEAGMTVKCDANGNPTMNISWSATVVDSFIITSPPNVITLISNETTVYTCTATNMVNNQTNIANKNITIYGRNEESFRFQVTPQVVGLSKNVTVTCEVDKIESLTVMNIKDNDNIMISVTSGSSSIEINYRNRIVNYTQDSRSVSFEMNLLNDSPRNFSCYAMFLSGVILQKLVFLKKSLEIKYENGNLTREGEYFNVSCLQNVGNNMSITLNLVGSQNWKSLQLISVLSEPVIFSVLVSVSYHQSLFYCSLHMNSTELSRSVGEKLIVYYLSNVIEIIPQKTDYLTSETIQCSAEGRPSPMIQWTSISPLTGILIANNNLILSTANGEYQYKCSAEIQYRTELMSVSKTIKFRVGQASCLKVCWMNLALVLLAIAFPLF